MLDSRLQHLELNGLPTSCNPFAWMIQEEKATLDELKTTSYAAYALKANMDILATSSRLVECFMPCYFQNCFPNKKKISQTEA